MLIYNSDTGITMKNTRKAFTLIELMIVVAVIALLAGVAVPKFADLIKKSREGSTKGNLAAIKSAIQVYYGDTEGFYPSGPKTNPSTLLSTTLVPKYIKEIPNAYISGYHAASNLVRTHEWPSDHTAGHDHGYWGYDSNLPGSQAWGTVYIWCTHADSKGTVWTNY